MTEDYHMPLTVVKAQWKVFALIDEGTGVCQVPAGPFERILSECGN